MAENSNIEWTHHTFNPWIGCTKVGPGCDHCYAEAWDARGLQQRDTRWGPHAARTRTSAANWRKPLKWDRDAAAAGERRRVFCASLADVFDNHPSILPEWRADLWELIARTPNLDWMLLTKRPGNIARYLPNDGRAGWYSPWNTAWPWPNVWLGCTVTDQAEANRDIPKFLEVPGKVHFLSMEPLLGPVDLTRLSPTIFEATANALTGYWKWEGGPIRKETKRLDLVIVGGESGPGARPMHPDWARSLRDQCQAGGVAFHFKQWGNWHADALLCTDTQGRRPPPSMNIGKKAAGRLLDGRTWDEMPGARHG